MKISVPALSSDLFCLMLTNLAAFLEKGRQHAVTKNFEPEVLINSRLAPDMLPLVRQVQIACDMAKGSVARLAGQEPPRFEDNETSIDELRARIGRTIDYLKSVPASAFEGSDARDIKVPAGERTLEFQGLDYLRKWAIPNVFFHITTAYDILRHNGVELGKRDFLRAGRDA